jgi:hypothetical protein
LEEETVVLGANPAPVSFPPYIPYDLTWARTCGLLTAGFFLGLFPVLEDGGGIFRNVGVTTRKFVLFRLILIL